MKKSRIFFVLCLFSMLSLLASCSNNNDSITSSPGNTGGTGNSGDIGNSGLVNDPTGSIPSFTLVPLNGLEGSLFTAAVGVDTHVAVGLSNTNTTIKAVRWDIDPLTATASAPTELTPIAGNTYSAAYDINGTGTIVGESAKGTTTVPVIWLAGETTPTELSMVGMGPLGAAFGINTSGQIVGHGTTLAGDIVGIVWTSTTADPIPLPTLGGASGSAYFIRDDGMITGEAETTLGAFYATLWKVDPVGALTTGPIDLGAGAENTGSIAFGINNLGEVIGETEDATGLIHGALWILDGTTVTALHDLGVPGAASSASAINSAGFIIGWKADAGIDMALAWKTENDAIIGFRTLLNEIGFSQAFAIDETDMVVGTTGATAFAAVKK